MYFLQLAAEPERFDKVTEYVFRHASLCVVLNGEDQKSRYGEGHVSYVGGEITIFGTYSPEGLARIFRMLGLTPSITTTHKGTYDEPETVVLVQRGKVFRYDLKDGSKWRKAA